MPLCAVLADPTVSGASSEPSSTEVQMTRRLLVVFAAAALLLLDPSGARAVVDGQPDFEHTYVGAIAAVAPGEGVSEPVVWCSGTLVAPAVFVTAAHCITDVDPGWTLLGVTFDRDLLDGVDRIVPVSSWVPHPAYTGTAAYDPFTDLGVALLAEPVTDVGFADLPALGQFDRLAPGPRSTFTTVGYGAQVYTPNRLVQEEARYVATAHLVRRHTRGDSALWALTRARGTGGGTCYGDSGGAVLWQDTDVLAAVHTTGGKYCLGGLGGELRLDTPFAQRFLGQFV